MNQSSPRAHIIALILEVRALCIFLAFFKLQNNPQSLRAHGKKTFRQTCRRRASRQQQKHYKPANTLTKHTLCIRESCADAGYLRLKNPLGQQQGF